MPLNPNTPASNPQPPTIPIGTTDSTWRYGFNPDRPMGEPVINFPYTVVKNVMFFVERIVLNPNELTTELGTPYQPTAGTRFLAFMKDAVLVHVEPVNGYARQHVYRFYYMVPPAEQYKYNIQEMKKIRDGYTLNSTASTGVFMNENADTEDLKDFYEITREWVEPLDSAYSPLALGSFDPSNEKLDPDFYDVHGYTAYDAQLVFEQVVQFEEEHLRRYFRRVMRVYKTLPGPVVKEFVPYSLWQNGDTVFNHGGPGSGLPESEWVAQSAIKLSREVWAAPLWPTEGGGSEPGQARIPHMPTSELEGQPLNSGWDKGSYPSLQLYTLVSMYRRNSNIVVSEDQNSLSGNCCNPDSRFVRCVNTTVTTSQSIDWTANGDVPAISPPDPGEDCSQWRVDSSVVVREGYSQKETRKTCTTYEQIDEFWESSFDRITNQVYPILRRIVHNPSTDFDKDWQEEGFTKYTDPMGNVYYGRKLESPETREIVNIPDTAWSEAADPNMADFTVEEDTTYSPGLLSSVRLAKYPISQGQDPFYLIALSVTYKSSGPITETQGTLCHVKYKGQRWLSLYMENQIPPQGVPSGAVDMQEGVSLWPAGIPTTLSQNGDYMLTSNKFAVKDILYSSQLGGTWDFPLASDTGNFFVRQKQAQQPASEVQFSLGALPAGFSNAYLYVSEGNLYITCFTNSDGASLAGRIPILMNGVEVYSITVSEDLGLAEEGKPTIQATGGNEVNAVSGDYVLSTLFNEDEWNIGYDKSQFPEFQFTRKLCVVESEGTEEMGHVYKVTRNKDLSRVVLRQWVNPCYAVDSYMQIPGIGYYRKYTTTINYSFPPVFGSIAWSAWDTRPDLSGKSGGQYFPQVLMRKDSYSGPCNAIVEEAFSPDGSWPAGWGLGTDTQFVTNSGYFASPLVDFRMPACLHGNITVTVMVGNQDSKWQSGVLTTTFPPTKYLDWRPVTSYYASPWNGGMLCKKVTINPPAA